MWTPFVLSGPTQNDPSVTRLAPPNGSPVALRPRLAAGLPLSGVASRYVGSRSRIDPAGVELEGVAPAGDPVGDRSRVPAAGDHVEHRRNRDVGVRAASLKSDTFRVHLEQRD